ncbi:hypothetical protein ACFL6I_20610 [candidate division KSB1 bacterium]
MSRVETQGLCAKLVFLKVGDQLVILQTEVETMEETNQNIKEIGNVVDVAKQLQSCRSSHETQAIFFV